MNDINNIIWTEQDLSESLKCKVNQSFTASGLSIDSRTIKKGEIFLAFKGELADGHNYIDIAVNNGASALIISQEIKGNYKIPIFKVKDTFEALYDLARYQRSRVNATYFAVTGSVGKTSVKEMLACCLTNVGKTYATKGNLNNHIGLPLCLCNMPINTQYAVFEMGMNHANEIRPLSLLVKPDVVIISNVEAVHLEFFESLQGIADAKSEILEGLGDNGIAVLNYDNPFFGYLSNKASQLNKKIKIVSFGFGNKADVSLFKMDADEESISAIANVLGENINYKISCTGEHQLLNSLAILAALKLKVSSFTKAILGLSNFYGAQGRGQRCLVNLPDGSKITLVDDSYNASPASVKAALKSLGKSTQRKIVVLGDMLELGDSSPQLHQQLAQEIIDNKVDMVFLVGNLMTNLQNNLPRDVMCYHTKTSKDICAILLSKLENKDIVLVKGSHGMKMDIVVNYILTLNQKETLESAI